MDDFINKGIKGYKPTFNEDHWKEAEALLNERERKRRFIWWPLALGIPIVLSIGLATYNWTSSPAVTEIPFTATAADATLNDNNSKINSDQAQLTSAVNKSIKENTEVITTLPITIGQNNISNSNQAIKSVPISKYSAINRTEQNVKPTRIKAEPSGLKTINSSSATAASANEIERYINSNTAIISSNLESNSIDNQSSNTNIIESRTNKKTTTPVVDQLLGFQPPKDLITRNQVADISLVTERIPFLSLALFEMMVIDLTSRTNEVAHVDLIKKASLASKHMLVTVGYGATQTKTKDLISNGFVSVQHAWENQRFFGRLGIGFSAYSGMFLPSESQTVIHRNFVSSSITQTQTPDAFYYLQIPITVGIKSSTFQIGLTFKPELLLKMHGVIENNTNERSIVSDGQDMLASNYEIATKIMRVSKTTYLDLSNVERWNLPVGLFIARDFTPHWSIGISGEMYVGGMMKLNRTVYDNSHTTGLSSNIKGSIYAQYKF